MKKILSATLVLCMLATACLSLVACNKVSKRDIKKDPVGTISEAFENALSQFFGDDAGAEKTLEKAFEKGSVNITLASGTLMGGELTEINETLYVNEKNGAFVSDTKLVYDGHRYKATLWGDKTGLTFQSASILGSDDALRLDFDTFIKYFSESSLFDYLYKYLGFTEDDAAATVSAVERLRGLIDEKKATVSEKDMEKLIQKLADVFSQKVDDEKIEDENGKEVKSIVVTYKVDNERIAEAYALIMDVFAESETGEGVTAPVLEYDLEADVFIHINAKTNTLSSMKVRADMTPVSPETGVRGETIMAEGELSFTAEKIQLTGKAKIGKTLYTLDAGVDKQTSGHKVTYDAWASIKTGNVRLDVLEATCTYHKKTGDLTLQGTVALNEADSITFSASANYTAGKTEVVFDLGTVQITESGEEIFSFGEEDTLRVVIKPLDEIPTPDGDGVDIVAMDEAEVADLFRGLAESDIARLVMQFLFQMN